MFTFRPFFRKAVAHPEEEAAYSEKGPMLTDLEKSELSAHLAPSLRANPQIRHRKRSYVHKLLTFALCLGFILFLAPSFTNLTFLRRVRTYFGHAKCNKGASHDQPVSSMAAPWAGDPVGARPLDRAGWTARCSTGSAFRGYECWNAIDGNVNSEWHSDVAPSHWIVIDLGREQKVHSLAMTPSTLGVNEGGMPRRHIVQVATEVGKWTTVAEGTWRGDETGVKYAIFEPQPAQFVNLTIFDTTPNRGRQPTAWVGISEIGIYDVPIINPPPPQGGRWGNTIDFPLVPVTAFVNPITGSLTTFSSYMRDKFKVDNEQTYSATWNPVSRVIEEKLIAETKHDMFCPGTSFDEKGSVIVTGGDSPTAFSIYNSAAGTYSTPIDPATQDPRELTIGRGYQGQTFLANGKTFMIGGAWSGPLENNRPGVGYRPGEIYDPKTQMWQQLTNLSGDFIKMDRVESCPFDKNWDWKCRSTEYEWQMHHAWLFAWKDNSVFHAGPSKKMNWFFTEVKGGAQKDAGVRADDFDAVCGVTSMYDAEAGLILTAGGSRNYHYWVNADRDDGRSQLAPRRNESTNNVFEIKLGDAGQQVRTRRLTSMKLQRVFANGVILPTGQTLVVGGQRQGEPFRDETWQAVPEIYTPEKDSWQDAARHSTPRGYHSWALLMPDASVVVGGAGLARAETDHYDAQIYYPPYYFQADGRTLATRPKINELDTSKAYKVGSTITFRTDVAVDAVSLIRYSAMTHAVNNDLRRIKLKPTSVGNPADRRYTVSIPGNPGVALPGYWMLFALNNGVPSNASTVQILANQPTIHNWWDENGQQENVTG